MAKKRKGKKKAQHEELENDKQEERLTLEALDAMSSDEDEGMVGGEDDDDQDEWNAEALALRQAIADGAFDHLTAAKARDESGDEYEAVDLDGGEEESEDDDQSDGEGPQKQKQAASGNEKALLAVLEEVHATKKGMPWAETFDVVPTAPLPWVNDGNALDVHDDLKREVAFYNLALESVKEARSKCRDAGIPFSRPDDFFAEMVKTDDHMAKVKDRLIFETKKMDAVAQRKANKEQKLRSKEKHANKLAEKAKRRKDHLKAVDEWAKSAASSRGGALQDEDDDTHLARMRRGWTDPDGNLQFGPNKKRMAADRKYGHGGKRGRFKQNDPKSLNDMSDFNPRGNFSGGKKSKGGSKRKGKRARDAARARR